MKRAATPCGLSSQRCQGEPVPKLECRPLTAMVPRERQPVYPDTSVRYHIAGRDRPTGLTPRPRLADFVCGGDGDGEPAT
jgi:hypothetical protein